MQTHRKEKFFQMVFFTGTNYKVGVCIKMVLFYSKTPESQTTYFTFKFITNLLLNFEIFFYFQNSW